jgi:autophagy-related protein 2
LLQLPPNFELAKAQVILLRLTIPVDIYSSPITVEVDGVEGKLCVHTDDRTAASKSKPGSRRSQSSRNKPPTSNDESSLPTAADLAQSFIQTEPPEERAELEAAISSQSQYLGASVAASDDDTDEDMPVGTGNGLELPDFMANFLQGIVDRLQVRIHGILINVEADVPSDTPETSDNNSGLDPVTIQLRIADIDIEGVTHTAGLGSESGSASGNSQQPSKLVLKEGKRLVRLRQIQGSLISEANLFANLARSSGLSSPTATHFDHAERRRDNRKHSIASRSSTQSSSTSSEPAYASKYSMGSPKRSFEPEKSFSSESGRFDDASEHSGNSIYSERIESFKTTASPPRVYGHAAGQDQSTMSVLGEEFLTPSALAFEGLHNLPEPASLPETPKASLTQPSKNYFDAVDLREDGPVVHSSFMPPRERSIEPADPVSSSQPLPSPRPDTKVFGQELPHPTHKEPHDMLYSSDAESDSSSASSFPEQDLAQSMMFSHDEAESMYMSAMSQEAPIVRMPGAWDASSDGSTPVSPPSSPKATKQGQSGSPDNLEHALHTSSTDVNTSSPNSFTTSKGSATSSPLQPPRGVLPVPSGKRDPLSKNPSNISQTSTISSEELSRIAKQVFHLDEVSIYLPSSSSASLDQPADTGSGSSIRSSDVETSRYASRSTHPEVPGSFSIRGKGKLGDHFQDSSQDTGVENRHESIDIVSGLLEVQFDVSVARLLIKTVQYVSGALNRSGTKDKPLTVEGSNQAFKLNLRLGQISIKFLEHLSGIAEPVADSRTSQQPKPSATETLLKLNLDGLDVKVDQSPESTKTSILLEKFVFGYAEESIVSFNADLRMRASVRDLSNPVGADVSINIIQTPSTTRYSVSTLPLHVSIDLQRLDETFSWFGGLSSMLNMGSSIASNATLTAGSPGKVAPKPRGVRFEAPINPEDRSLASQNKADARIGGFVLDLIGKECSIGVQTTAVKIVAREEGMGVGIDRIKLSGPHFRHSQAEPAITAEVLSTRLELLSTPKDVDLDRLLALITPSKSKYDQGDDILLDTLIRQRKQVSVVKITVDGLKAHVDNLEDLKFLPGLGEEVSRLSTVAKYLPEDDRPGLLSLLLVRKLDVNVEVNKGLGSFQLISQDLEIAQITFPTLVALSIGTLDLTRNDMEILIGEGTDADLCEPSQRQPAVMARMIGDEMEPVVKIKLWNLEIAYRVPTILAIMGLTDDATVEDMSASLATSIATLTDHIRESSPNPASPVPSRLKDTKKSEAKPMIIDVVIRDCILGLNPLGLPSKVLVVMTEAHLSAALPKEQSTVATVELNKASLLVIDNVANISTSHGAARPRRGSFDGGSSQVADLCAMGFVSVSYISSAKATIKVVSSPGIGEQHVDFELRDDLFVMESCADSTQTLIAALNSLKPPMPPSKETKYRTKVIPVQDLLASLSGDAFGTAEGEYGFDEDFGQDIYLDNDDMDDVESDTDNLDFNSRYYEKDTPTNDVDAKLGRGLSSMQLSTGQLTSRDTQDGVLLDSFSEQSEPLFVGELDFQEDHFGAKSPSQGPAQRWDSAKNTYDKTDRKEVKESPLKVRVRDVHIIWNLFDGYDWQHTRDTITKAVQDVESKAIERRSRNDRRPTFDQDVDDEEDVIGDFLFNSIYIGISANRDPRELALQINQELNDGASETESIATTVVSASPSRQGMPTRRGKRLKLERSKHHKITFELKGVNVDLIVFPPGSGETQSSIDVRVHDFDIFDHVPTSTWKKFATYMHDAGERESGTNMIHLEILNVKPVPELAASEIVLKVTVLPLRLHVDQDALDFITRFFEFKDDSAPPPTSPGEDPFLQRVEVNAIQVKLDFKPKRVDYAGLRSGHTTEFMNFLILDEADMVLRHTIIYGISGFDKLGKCLNDIWMPDVKRNQLPGILAGLAPVRSLVNVGGGVRDLVVVPMREYKKDGRVVRSISKGAAAFAKTTGTELIKLGAKLAIGTQTVLQGAEEFLSKPGSSRDAGWEDADLDEEEKKQISLYADQPIGVIQGLRGAYSSLQRDLLIARDAIIAVPGEVMESGSAQGAAKAVLGRAPTVIFRPAIGATKAISQTLMGAGNTLDPQNRRRVRDVSIIFAHICLWGEISGERFTDQYTTEIQGELMINTIDECIAQGACWAGVTLLESWLVHFGI